jgi:hypothetical protein
MTTATNKDFGINFEETKKSNQNTLESPKKESLWKQIIHSILYPTRQTPQNK